MKYMMINVLDVQMSIIRLCKKLQITIYLFFFIYRLTSGSVQVQFHNTYDLKSPFYLNGFPYSTRNQKYKTSEIYFKMTIEDIDFLGEIMPQYFILYGYNHYNEFLFQNHPT